MYISVPLFEFARTRRIYEGSLGSREELPCRAAGLWGLSNGKCPEAIARWFSAERL